jgi:2-keto-4-pentenoate hydratase
MHMSATSTGQATATAVRAAADRLSAATASRRPCVPVRDLIGATDEVAAYAVQELVATRWIEAGATVVGRKIGLTSPAVQGQLGVDRPDFGVLFDDMNCSGLPTVPIDRLLQPKVETEIAFVLGEDLPDGADPSRVRTAVGYAVAAIEIVDSRIADWDISFGDTVADNASSGLFVLGTERVGLAAFEPRAVVMSMSMDGGVVSTGNGAACLGDPLHALAWLADKAAELGDPLRAGQVVLSGALGPMVPVRPGAVVTAVVTSLGSVTATFSPEASR